MSDMNKGIRFGSEGVGPLSGLTKREVTATLAADTEEFLENGGEVRVIPFLITTAEFNQNVRQYERVQLFGDRWGDVKMGDIADSLYRAGEREKRMEVAQDGD